jgi:hypothetical protein
MTHGRWRFVASGRQRLAVHTRNVRYSIGSFIFTVSTCCAAAACMQHVAIAAAWYFVSFCMFSGKQGSLERGLHLVTRF